jgi:hypothetical protein
MKRSERLHKSEAARKRRKNIKEIKEGVKERLYTKLRKERKKKK